MLYFALDSIFRDSSADEVTLRNFLVLLFVLIASTSSGAQTTAPVDRAAIDREVKVVVISTTRAVLDELTGIEQLFFIQTKDAIEKLVLPTFLCLERV